MSFISDNDSDSLSHILCLCDDFLGLVYLGNNAYDVNKFSVLYFSYVSYAYKIELFEFDVLVIEHFDNDSLSNDIKLDAIIGLVEFACMLEGSVLNNYDLVDIELVIVKTCHVIEENYLDFSFIIEHDKSEELSRVPFGKKFF